MNKNVEREIGRIGRRDADRELYRAKARRGEKKPNPWQFKTPKSAK